MISINVLIISLVIITLVTQLKSIMNFQINTLFNLKEINRQTLVEMEVFKDVKVKFYNDDLSDFKKFYYKSYAEFSFNDMTCDITIHYINKIKHYIVKYDFIEMCITEYSAE
ncbi:MAG: hypothetical protein WBO70_05510 [Erysipelotrichaceae bacterium]